MSDDADARDLVAQGMEKLLFALGEGILVGGKRGLFINDCGWNGEKELGMKEEERVKTCFLHADGACFVSEVWEVAKLETKKLDKMKACRVLYFGAVVRFPLCN